MHKAIFGQFTSTPAVNSPSTTEQNSRVWWILDTTHSHQCNDCKRMAANSPYTPPWDETNPLRQTPGDGATSCGGDCTCILSYSPPGPNNPDMAEFGKRRHLSEQLQTYTHGQMRFIEECGLEARDITIHDYVDALVLHDGRIIKAGEYQFFLTSESREAIELWEYPADIPFPPDGKWRKRFDEGRKLVAQWHIGQIHWVLHPYALRRYEGTAPNIPEWRDDDDKHWQIEKTVAQQVLSVALKAAQQNGCIISNKPDTRDVRVSYHHVGYDVRLHGTRTVTFKNGTSREQFTFLYVHVVPTQDADGERYVVRSCLVN